MRSIEQHMRLGDVSLRSRLWCGPARFVGLNPAQRQEAVLRAAQGLTSAVLLRVAIEPAARSEPQEPVVALATAELRALMAAARDQGAELIVELSHGGPRCADWSPARALGADECPDPVNGRRPRLLDDSMAEHVLTDFERSTRLLADMGARIVALDLAGGSLLHHLCSVACTQHKPASFALVREIVARVSSLRPTLLHMALQDLQPGGRSPTQGIEQAVQLAELGAAAFVVTAGARGRRHLEQALRPPRQLREGRHARLAGWLARRLRVPVGLLGGLRSRSAIEHILDEHGLDFALLERPFLAEADLSLKLASAQAQSLCTSQSDCLGAAATGTCDPACLSRDA